jgi:uncharacterized protein YjbJ (UPF0337 family)
VASAEEKATAIWVMANRQTRSYRSPFVDSNGHIIIHKEVAMKSGTRDQAEGNLHQVKGRIKEVAGKITGSPELETEGKDENTAGKVQEKAGDIKKVVGK